MHVRAGWEESMPGRLIMIGAALTATPASANDWWRIGAPAD